MSNLSIFLREKKFYVNIDEFSKIYVVSERNDLADSSVFFLQNALQESNSKEIKKIVFPVGAMTFTTARIINSVVKGFYICDQNIISISVDVFLPYIYMIHKYYPDCVDGIIAISTMKGDFFTGQFHKGALLNKSILTADDIKKIDNCVFYNNDAIFNHVNFANLQINLLCSEYFLCKNCQFIEKSINARYEYSPKY